MISAMIDEFSGLSRRGLLGAGAAAAIGAALSGAFPKSIAAQGETTDDLVFVNGRIHTMDGKNTIAGSVSTRNGRFLTWSDCEGYGRCPQSSA